MVTWHSEADVVVIGSGATGIPAAIVAREAGASVILVEAQPHLGGHAIVSGGNVPLGGGTSAQKKHGIEDSPDLVFHDLTDWSVVQPNGFPGLSLQRPRDRPRLRRQQRRDLRLAAGAWRHLRRQGARTSAAAFRSATRCRARCIACRSTGRWRIPASRSMRRQRKTYSIGAGFMYPLIDAARRAGVDILLEHRMTALHRENGTSGRVIGIEVDHRGTRLAIRARKAVIIGTGGSIGNVNFRRMFDPRLTEEYCGLAGMPWSDQDASGEIAAMAVGAALWGLFNQTGEFGFGLTKAGHIGCQYGYRHLAWRPEQRGVRSCPRDRSLGGGLAERHPRQHAGPAVL